MIFLRVPATSANLGPGFDAFGIALNLYNEFAVRCQGEEAFPPGFSLLPSKNLAAEGAALLAMEAGHSLPDLEFGIRASIPRARGLGSSATLSVAGLKAADVLLGTKLSQRELLTLASGLEGHPDNAAPALLGGFVISVQEDGQIDYLRSLPPRPLQIIAGVPNFELETLKSRQVLPAQVGLKDAAFNVGRAGLLAAALITGQYELLRCSMEDRLHQPYRRALVVGLEAVMAAVLAQGALGVCLSGSGPTILAFCEQQPAKLCQVIETAWADAGVSARTYHLNIAAQGAQQVADFG